MKTLLLLASISISLPVCAKTFTTMNGKTYGNICSDGKTVEEVLYNYVGSACITSSGRIGKIINI